MKRAELHRKIRKSHRYLGVALSVQFLFWTLGGLYFSWSDMDDVHGDYQKNPASMFSTAQTWSSPSVAINSLRQKFRVDSIVSIQTIALFEKPIYQIHYTASNSHSHPIMRVQLADAQTGRLRPALSKAEAVQLAKSRFNGKSVIKKAELLTHTNGHHEYRRLPLPAYAISFESPNNTTVYIASELGTIQKYRNTKWRIFDFLWMLHTMDYQTRDHFGNRLLQMFSIFGLLTVVSGFTLFFLSAKKKPKI